MDVPAVRTVSFGAEGKLTLVDRFGIWLSARQLHRRADFAGKRVGDFGCGFHATFSRSILQRAEHVTLADVSLAPDLKEHPKVTAMEGVLPGCLRAIPSATLDIVLCISVLEHLWDPAPALFEFRRVLAPGGHALFNVPSWRGRPFLEFSAFRLGLSPSAEMDDHKMYYDVRDLWPLLVRAGFRPSGIRCFPHKFGLNTFAICRADE